MVLSLAYSVVVVGLVPSVRKSFFLVKTVPCKEGFQSVVCCEDMVSPDVAVMARKAWYSVGSDGETQETRQ